MIESRPLITFALFAYNHERFAAEAVRGALSQTYSPLEILISDDCSADRTFEIIQAEVAEYSGPHSVRLNRNERNLGFGANINRVMELAGGDLIVAASADDVSLPDRVEILYQAYADSNGKELSIFSNAVGIDENSNPDSGTYLASVDQESLSASYLARRLGGVLGATHAWHRRVFDFFGPIIEKRLVMEDVIISFRAALLGAVGFIDKPLVLYRIHSTNMYNNSPENLGPEEVEPSLLKHADLLIDACHQRLRDTETVLRRFPERRAEVLKLKNNVLKCLREKEDEKALLLTPSPIKRLRIIGRAFCLGTPPRRIVRWVLTFFFPRIYLTYQRRLRLATANSGSGSRTAGIVYGHGDTRS